MYYLFNSGTGLSSLSIRLCSKEKISFLHEMRLSEFTLINLTRAVCGDASYTPYLRGHEIIHLFNKYGYNEVYGAGFPSRWKYTEDKLRELNGTDKVRQIIEDTVDPRRFHNLEITHENAVKEINEAVTSY